MKSENYKRIIISLLCSKFINGDILDRASIFSLAFLHKDPISSLKFRRLSILIPKSFSHLLTDKTLKGENMTLIENEKVVSDEKRKSLLEMKREKQKF